MAEKNDEPKQTRSYKWEMVIDLDRCTGCEACVVACHAENNIRISGEREAAEGRAINWIRIERYWEGDYPNVTAKFASARPNGMSAETWRRNIEQSPNRPLAPQPAGLPGSTQ